MSPRQAWGVDAGLCPPALVPALWKVCRGLRRGPAWTCGRRSEALLPRSVLTARGGSPSGPGPHCRLLARAGGGRHGDVFSEDTDSRRPGDRLPGPTSPQTCPQRALAVAAAVARGGRGRWAEGRGRRAQSHAGPWRQPLLPLALLPARQAPFQAGSALEVTSTSGRTRSSGTWRVQCPRLQAGQQRLRAQRHPQGPKGPSSSGTRPGQGSDPPGALPASLQTVRPVREGPGSCPCPPPSPRVCCLHPTCSLAAPPPRTPARSGPSSDLGLGERGGEALSFLLCSDSGPRGPAGPPSPDTPACAWVPGSWPPFLSVPRPAISG